MKTVVAELFSALAVFYFWDFYATAVILSSDKLVTGETYTVSAGTNSEEITISAGENSIGSQSGGMGFGSGNGTPPSGAPGETGGTPPKGNGSMGQPVEKPTDANGNELAMPEPPNSQGSTSESN